MIYSVDLENMAGTIKHVDVAKYLRDLNWQEVPSKRDKVKIFQLETNGEFYQVDLPVSKDLRDYNAAMYRAVECIALSMRKSTEHVILELVNPLSDILRLRITEPNIETGSVLVEDAIKFYDNAKKLLTATAMDILHPQLYRVGRLDNAVTEFVNSCRFGQTEIGSYVVSIVCPILVINNNQIQQLTLFDDKEAGANSFTRNVVNKLITSVNLVREEIDQGALDKRFAQCADSQNFVSVNFIDALNGINIYRDNSRLDITAEYASTLQGNTLLDASASINHDYYEPMNSIVKKIKTRTEREKNIFGQIKKLDAVPDSSIRDGGTISVVFLDDAQKKACASVTLSKDDYITAIEAHRDGKFVRIAGVMSGRTNKKIDCRHFEVLS